MMLKSRQPQALPQQNKSTISSGRDEGLLPLSVLDRPWHGLRAGKHVPLSLRMLMAAGALLRVSADVPT